MKCQSKHKKLSVNGLNVDVSFAFYLPELMRAHFQQIPLSIIDNTTYIDTALLYQAMEIQFSNQNTYCL